MIHKYIFSEQKTLPIPTPVPFLHSFNYQGLMFEVTKMMGSYQRKQCLLTQVLWKIWDMKGALHNLRLRAKVNICPQLPCHTKSVQTYTNKSIIDSIASHADIYACTYKHIHLCHCTLSLLRPLLSENKLSKTCTVIYPYMADKV